MFCRHSAPRHHQQSHKVFLVNNFFIVLARYLNIFSTWKIMSLAPKRLTGDKAAIDEFIDKFDVRYPVLPDVNQRDNLADGMS
jgi:hypothetical protein